MERALDTLSVLLIVVSLGCFAWGFAYLGRGEDLQALYLLVVGALLLAAANRLLQPGYGRR